MFNLKILIFIITVLAIGRGEQAFRTRARRYMDSIVEIENFVAAETQLKNSLTRIAATTGPKYRLARVNTAYTATGTGTMTKYNADLFDEHNKIKHCSITLWSRPWLENEIEVTFECDGEDIIVRKYNG
uniref:Cystatin domain-containing protein n=1 Tax=Glossina brevipalpis TaxID=37001 RepID=A0A1A9WNF7_9MUSC